MQGIRMSQATAAGRVKRYASMARLFYKYGNKSLVTQAGLDDALDSSSEQDDPSSADSDALAGQLAADLERLGPAYIKLGQLLSTRSDLLPASYLDALSRLQDKVEPFPFADVERIVQEELGVRLSKGFASFD